MNSHFLLFLTLSGLILTNPWNFSLGKKAQTLAQELPFSADRTFFTGKPPQLLDFHTPYNSVNYAHPKYFVTIKVPQESKQSLGQVTIHQEENFESITIKLEQTEAFLGTQNNRGKAIEVKAIDSSSQPKTIMMSFNPPIPPGNTFTISLHAVENPSMGGTYQFRVQAFPAGQSPVGLDLGVGRLRFYENF